MCTRRFFVKLLITILISTSWSVLPAHAQGEEPTGSLDEPLTLSSVTSLALAQNPAVRRARVEIEAADLARRGAGAPTANPALTFEGGPRFGPNGPQADVGISLEIPFDLGGTSRRLRASSSAALDAAQARLQWVELGVSTATRVLFAEAVAAGGRTVVAQEAVALAEELERVARRRHELGEVSILEPNFAGLERTQAQGGLLSARLDEARAYRALAGFLALPADATLTLVPPLPPSWKGELPPTVQHLAAQAARRPDLASATAQARAADANIEVARGRGAPGLSVAGGWAREGDEANLVTGAVRFELPVQRNQLAVAGARGAAGVATIDAEIASMTVSRELTAAVDGWETAVARYALATEQALPLAEENLRLVLRAYSAGKEELLAVLLMQRQALGARQSAITAQLDLHRAAAALERAIAQEVF